MSTPWIERRFSETGVGELLQAHQSGRYLSDRELVRFRSEAISTQALTRSSPVLVNFVDLNAPATFEFVAKEAGSAAFTIAPFATYGVLIVAWKRSTGVL